MKEKKILVIDDEFPIRYLVEHQLQRKGYKVASAKDGPTGIRTASAYQPDLIVLDVMMPDMDGFEVCKRIRETPELATTPVIFLTSLMTKEYKTMAFDVGADDYLVKPFQADELIAHMTAVFRRSSHVNGSQKPILPQTKEAAKESQQRIVSLYSPKGGVGTTTLAVQLSESLALRENQSIMLLDLDLPYGGIAPMLTLYTRYHTASLLKQPPNIISGMFLQRFAQRHRANLRVIPAPGEPIPPAQMPSSQNLEPILRAIVDAGYHVIIDAGSQQTALAIEALRVSDISYIISSGQPVANKLINTFMEAAPRFGLEPHRLLPVVNELHGEPNQRVDLRRIPVARIPHANERSRTRLWLRDQGMHKLVSIIV